MADWNANIGITALYTALLTLLGARDVDAVTLGKTAYTNPPDGAIEYNRAGSKFREWSSGGAAYSDVVISIAGGGTGAITAAAARTALGLGSMATQDNNAVNITGGAIAGVNLNAGDITAGTLALNRGGTGASLGLGAARTYLRSDGATVAFSAIQLLDLPAIPVATQFPIGGGCEWFTDVAPANFIILDGSAVSRTVTYAALFALWGTTFGVGDGATTFNLPDLRKRIPIGKDAGTGAIDTVGKKTGSFDHTHTGPSHTHTYSDVINHTHPINITDPGHTHNWNSDKSGVGGGPGPFGIIDASHAEAGYIDSSATGITATSSNPAGGVATGTTNASGTGATGTANPPFFTVNYIARYV